MILNSLGFCWHLVFCSIYNGLFFIWLCRDSFCILPIIHYHTSFWLVPRFSCITPYHAHIQSYLSMQSPLLSSHLYLKVTFSCPVIEHFKWIQPLLKGHLSYKATFFLSQMWPLNTGWTVYLIIYLPICM